jgi:hypothetical protein
LSAATAAIAITYHNHHRHLPRANSHPAITSKTTNKLSAPTAAITITHKQRRRIPPTTIMSSHHPHSYSKLPAYTHNLEFTLDFEKPETNLCGIMAFCANNVKNNSKLIDKVTIFKPLYSPRDRKLIKATLDKDRTGITFVESSSPSYFSKDASNIPEVEKDNKGGLACKQTEQAHQVAANSIQLKVELCLQHVRLNLPNGISCKVFTQEVRRVAKQQGKLKNLFRMVEVKIREDESRVDLMWHAPHVIWIFLINREARHLKKEDSDSDDNFLEATKCMSKVLISNTP